MIEKQPTTVAEAAEALAGFAMDRGEIKIQLDNIPDEADIDKTLLEYEIQLLRIVFTGWALSFFMPDLPQKNDLAKSFWLIIYQLAQKISELVSSTSGIEVNYFDSIRERTEIYTGAMTSASEGADPAEIIGSAFAGLCDNVESQPIIDSGKWMFGSTLATVKAYLDSIEIHQEQ